MKQRLLFIDDVRNPYNNKWALARSVKSACAYFTLYSPTVFSLDYDLGNSGEIIMEFVDFIVWKLNKWERTGLHYGLTIFVHSSNPVAFGKIKNSFNRYNYVLVMQVETPKTRIGCS